MYEFSIPMLYDWEMIDEVSTLNDSLTKSKVVSFYDSLPQNSNILTGLEQSRGINPNVKNIDDFMSYVKYVKNKGFKFIYLLNSVYPIGMSDVEEHKKNITNLDIIIKKLRDVGCNTFRVGNTSVIQYLTENYPDIEIITSTVLGYNTFLQYSNLLKAYPNIKEFCLHYDNNRNFKLLKNLVDKLPNVRKEVMVNEMCIKNCPFRASHYSMLFSDPKYFPRWNVQKYFLDKCYKISDSNQWEEICKSNVIYPWLVETYAKYGINKFKIIGRFYDKESIRGTYNFIFNYLHSVEDDNFAKNLVFGFFHNVRLKNSAFWYETLKVKDVREYLPDIEHFVKSGHLCSSVCGAECNYCSEKAKILDEKFPLE